GSSSTRRIRGASISRGGSLCSSAMALAITVLALVELLVDFPQRPKLFQRLLMSLAFALQLGRDAIALFLCADAAADQLGHYRQRLQGVFGDASVFGGPVFEQGLEQLQARSCVVA